MICRMISTLFILAGFWSSSPVLAADTTYQQITPATESLLEQDVVPKRSKKISSVSVPFNPAIERATLIVTGADAPKLSELQDAKGSKVNARPESRIAQLTEMSNGFAIVVTKPGAGYWILRWSSTKPAHVQVKIQSPEKEDTHIRGLEFVEFGGIPGHEAFAPKKDYVPAKGEIIPVEIAWSGPVRDGVFEAVSNSGASLGPLESLKDPHSPHVYRLRVPNQPFYVRLKGGDASGFPVQRYVPAPISPH